MGVTIERFAPARHDARTVARLIYQADPSLMHFVFGDESAAERTIAKLVGMEHNEYAGSRVTCAVHDGEVVGVIAGFTGAQKSATRAERGREWGRALGVRGMVRAVRWGTKLASVATSEVGEDEYYISALTVDERFRGEGIGSHLIESVLADHTTVITDVNIAKDASIRFYERHGFTVGKQRTFDHKGDKLGNYQIRRG